MNLVRAFLIGLILLGGAGAASAQSASVDVKRLPVDLDKLTRQLRQTAGSESHEGLHIRYTVDVYGEAPRIDLFTKQDNLTSGPVPYGAPTHRDMIEHVTPMEYRAPYADLSALLRWLSEKSKK